jgi:hypothetical protein|tara:strand:- start:36 stop:323 length:288 start_codon:yes stop_codon:yes gene_type:complete
MTQFKDLIFKDHTYMINAHHVFDNDWEISVSAGNGIYCSPKKNLKNQESFSSFEIAIFNEKGEYATGEVLQIDNDVVGWQGREDINNIIEMIISQ